MQFLMGNKSHFGRLKSKWMLLALFFLVAFAKKGNAQEVAFDSLIVPEIFKEEVELFEVDRFSSIYVVNAKQDLIKYDASGMELFRFSNYNNGSISLVDVSNPMQILVYYSDFLLIKVLDRTLSEIGNLSLQNQEIYNPVSLCRSNNNGLWIFDPLSQLLQRVDKLGERPVLSQNLAMQFNKNLSPIQMIEYQNRLFMLIPEEGILVFDIFGQFIETLNFVSSSPIVPYGKKIYAINEGQLNSLDLETRTEDSLELIESKLSIDALRFSSTSCYYLANDNLYTIRLKR